MDAVAGRFLDRTNAPKPGTLFLSRLAIGDLRPFTGAVGNA